MDGDVNYQSTCEIRVFIIEGNGTNLVDYRNATLGFYRGDEYKKGWEYIFPNVLLVAMTFSFTGWLTTFRTPLLNSDI